jgi:multidrug efflux pump subunit AcrA (membrane-fusion protein)
MSDQSYDAQLIEQTKQQIKALVAEIAQLSRTEVDPQEFYGQMLPRVVTALAAIGGVVWTLEDQNRLTLQYQVNLQEAHLPVQDQDQMTRHARLLQKVIRSGEGLLVPPHSGSGDEDGGANPTDCLLVLGPLKTELEVKGVVEIFQRAEAGPSTQKGYLRFLLQMCELAGDYLKSRDLRHFSDRQLLWTQLEEFTRLVHASLNPRETAYTIANEGRRLIECDRVSVAVRQGDRCVVEAVSGQDLFDKRSNTIRLLNRVASVVVAGGEPVWYTGDTSNMAPQVEDAMQEYVDESHSKTVAVLPLARPEPEEKERDRPDEPTETPEPVGALIVELIEDARVPDRMRHRVDVVCQHSAVAMANALEHESLFLMPLWRTLGKARWIVRARNLPKVLVAVGLALGLVLAAVLVPYDFALRSEGTLEPVVKRDVYAGVDGTVDQGKVFVEHGQSVKAGQVLVQLRNHPLQQAFYKVEGDLLTAQKDFLSTQANLVSNRSLTPEERGRLTGHLAELREKISALQSEQAVLRQQIAELTIKSPIDGVVTTWDVKRLLENRFVRQGQRILEVADPDQAWELELHVPEDRMGHIARAQNALYDRLRSRLREVALERLREKVPDATDDELAAETDRQVAQVPDAELRATLRELSGDDMNDQLDVTYILATDPGRKHTGKVRQIHLYAEVRGEQGNTVRVKVDLDKGELRPEHVRQGAAVTAKIDCGRRSIGYVWLHDVIAWGRKMWFRWF